MAGLPKTMRAAWYEGAGPAESVLRFGDLPLPTRHPGHVLIEVHYSSVNPVDFKLRKDVPPGCKFIPSADVAGIVVESDVSSGFKRGQRVFAMMPMLGSVATTVGKVHYGGCAEYAVIKEEHLARVSEDVSLEAAAGVPLVALTAVQNLEKAGLTKKGGGVGRHMLVLAGAGGVGNWAIQLGKVAACKVSATASTRNHEFLQSLGAEECVDYNIGDWASAAREFSQPPDTVFDLMGGDDELRSLRLLPRTGHYLNIMNSGWVTKFGKPGFLITLGMVGLYRGVLQHVIGPNYHFTIVHPNGHQLQHISDLLASGDCKAVVDSVHELEDLAAAHNKVEASHCRGKVIIRIRGSNMRSRM